jgi:predicted phage-related endonuclease
LPPAARRNGTSPERAPLHPGPDREQKALRKDALGGSDANTIMGGDEKKLLRLWREKRGEAEPEDLSDILAVQMGSFTEPFNVGLVREEHRLSG